MKANKISIHFISLDKSSQFEHAIAIGLAVSDFVFKWKIIVLLVDF